MPRTNSTNVGKIIEVDTSIDLAPFIEVANDLVTECCADALKADGTTAFYSGEQLEQIERWLAAHFYAIRDPRASDEKAGTVSQTIESKVDLGLNVTRYGQMALRIDRAGGLAALEAAAKGGGVVTASAVWLGTEGTR